jgi:EAL and modified HD-GYP domain-containing signal transduction protein
MNTSLILARQPIVDINEDIFGYEFFYRDEEGNCDINDARHATSSVLVNLLNQIGTAASFGSGLAFINTDGPLFLTDIIRNLPKDKFVFELSSDMKHNAQIHEAIRNYRSLGYRFALDNASFHPNYIESFASLFEYMEFAKFDVNQTDIEQLNLLPNPFGKMKLIAQRIEFYELLEAYKKVKFDYFQGFYFAKSHLITHTRVDPRNADVLSLFSLLQTDASLDELYISFKRQNALSLQLIQFLSSTNPEYIEGASSIKEMIERMGKNALMQWLLLIIYSKSAVSTEGRINDYTLFTQKRVDLVLALLHLALKNPSDKQLEYGRIVALYSLLETAMNLPIEQILQQFNPNNEIKDALLINAGVLGRAYAASLKLENNDIDTAFLLLKSYGVSHESIEELSAR